MRIQNYDENTNLDELGIWFENGNTCFQMSKEDAYGNVGCIDVSVVNKDQALRIAYAILQNYNQLQEKQYQNKYKEAIKRLTIEELIKFEEILEEGYDL